MTSKSNQTKALGTIDTNGEYSKFLLSVAAILQDLKERIHAEYNKTRPGEIERIELMSLDAYTSFMTMSLNFGIGRSILRSTARSDIKNSMVATSTNKKSGQSKSATAVTLKPTGSHSSNSRGGQTKK